MLRFHWREINKFGIESFLKVDGMIAFNQGCQIFVDKIYQNGGQCMYQNTTKLPNGYTVHQMAEIYSKWQLHTFTNIFHCKTLQILPKFGFWFENTPSGNLVSNLNHLNHLELRKTTLYVQNINPLIGPGGVV
jgi:hypothetical protein